MFEHSCVAAVCENNQPIMVKLHPLIFFNLKKIINSLSERAVSDSPSVHVTEGKKSRPFVTLPYQYRQPWVRSCGPPPPLLITCCSCWRYTMSAPKRLFKYCVLGCTNEHRSLHRLPPSEPLRTRWLSFFRHACLKKCPGKKTVKSPIRLGINTNTLCANVSSRQSKYYAFVFQIAFLKELLGTL